MSFDLAENTAYFFADDEAFEGTYTFDISITAFPGLVWGNNFTFRHTFEVLAADPVIIVPEPEEEIIDEALIAEELFDSVVAEVESGLPSTIEMSSTDSSKEYLLGTTVYSFGQKKSEYVNYLLEMQVEPLEAEAFI